VGTPSSAAVGTTVDPPITIAFATTGRQAYIPAFAGKIAD